MNQSLETITDEVDERVADTIFAQVRHSCKRGEVDCREQPRRLHFEKDESRQEYGFQNFQTRRPLDELSRCKGYEAVWYGDKVRKVAGEAFEGMDGIEEGADYMQDCQRKGWKEKGPNAECKILKAVRGIVGGIGGP
jgi:hypothetical protein